MKFLLDTNVVIPLEPVPDGTVEDRSNTAARFHSSAVRQGHQVFVHPAMIEDIRRDPQEWRRELRRQQVRKYPVLERPPPLSASAREMVGSAVEGSNDWVDDQMLAAVYGNAVDYVVTEDQGLHRKARRLGCGERIATLAEAVALVSDLSDLAPAPPPAVESLPAYALDPSDPIFESFRIDYPGFDDWLARCQRQHRQSWTIRGETGRLAAVMIVKPEDDGLPQPLTGRTLKVCTIKVATEAQGLRYGELLLKVLFEYAVQNRYEWVYVTAFDKHAALIRLLEDFGFGALAAKTPLGESILAKRFTLPTGASSAEPPLDFHIRYGPPAVASSAVEWYAVPIQPRYTDILFPETEDQYRVLREVRPFGNAIRKAYLCHAGVRQIEPGSLLFFYRSEREQGFAALGVAESTVRSADPDEITRAVGKRTVYTLAQIQGMCEKPVLAILFRQARIIMPVLPAVQLLRQGVLNAAPQTITKIRRPGREWLQRQLGL
jgi:L-amino acid N-acyltransferase YncA